MSEIAITVGRETIGHVIERSRGRHQAVDYREQPIGFYPTANAAREAVLSVWMERATA